MKNEVLTSVFSRETRTTGLLRASRLQARKKVLHAQGTTSLANTNRLPVINAVDICQQLSSHHYLGRSAAAPVLVPKGRSAVKRRHRTFVVDTRGERERD